MARRKTSAEPRPPMPRLNIKGPLALGLAAVVVFFGVGLAAAAMVSIDHGAGFPGSVAIEPKVTVVSHAKGGIAARVHVSDGVTVGAGDLLISLDTSALDELIRLLTMQAEAAARQLSELRQATATVVEADASTPPDRPQVLTLGRSAAALEKQTAGLLARIAVAEQALALSAIRAPATGRVRVLTALAANAVITPGAPLLEIESAGDRLVLDGYLPVRDMAAAKPGMQAKVWLAGSLRPLGARLAWISTELIEDKRGAAAYLVRIELDSAAADAALRTARKAAKPAHILVVTGARTLLAALLDPLRRNIRLFRA